MSMLVTRGTLGLALAITLSGCTPEVNPAARTGAAVAFRPSPSAGVGVATNWKDGAMILRPDPSACPKQKEALEKSLGLKEAVSCPIVRAMNASQGGDGDTPIGMAVAPHCYVLGSVILVIQYETPANQCTRVAGIAVLPKK